MRVHTALGTALVLMPLRDGRNVRLKLARDLEAPVARAKLTDLRDARWI